MAYDEAVESVPDDVTEFREAPDALLAKAVGLARQIRDAKHFVVYTGAGVSTAADIPDYRGPNGVWTLKAQGKKPTMKVALTAATPTYTHMALAALYEAELLRYVVSTNCDGLHRRSGLPRAGLADLHGNIYREYCMECGADFIRPFDVRPPRRQFVHARRATGRLCEKTDPRTGVRCTGLLRDSIVNFGEHLPASEFREAEEHSRKADVALVLGTSMRVKPSCDLPSLSYTNGGSFTICNLQRTPYDVHCSSSGGFRVFTECDRFMKMVMDQLGIEVPPYAEDADAVRTLMANIVVDPDFGQGMRKYNVMTMADDGPPPPAVLDAIKAGFTFTRSVDTQEKTGIPLGQVAS